MANYTTKKEATVPELTGPKAEVLQEMLQAGVHLGHRTSRWFPKMQDYIHGVKGTVHVLNLEKTLEKLTIAEKFVEDSVREGKIVLFVGTKPSAKTVIEEEAKRCGMPYVTNRWLGGTLTNFKSIHDQLKKFSDLEMKKAKGDLEKYTKKEQLEFSKKLVEYENKFGGIKFLNRSPEIIFIVDTTKETTAVKEANRMRVSTVAIVDTNADPSQVTYPIPGNDDAITSVTLLVKRISNAVVRGKSAINNPKQ